MAYIGFAPTAPSLKDWALRTKAVFGKMCKISYSTKSKNKLAPKRHQPAEQICPIPCNIGALNGEKEVFGLAHNLHYMTRLNNSK